MLQIQRISQALLPDNCVLCGLTSGQSLSLCADCAQNLPQNPDCCPRCAEPRTSSLLCGHCLAKPPDFHVTLAPWLYAHPVNHLLLRFKNRGDLACGKALTHALVGKIRQHYAHAPKPTILIPVPLHWKKRWQRGFNQSLWLARYLSRQLGIPIQPRAVIRNRQTASQQSLNRLKRQRNLRGCFTVKQPLAGHHIAIVDDVMTTTSTANELATTLLHAGAVSVDCWCLARTPVEK